MPVSPENDILDETNDKGLEEEISTEDGEGDEVLHGELGSADDLESLDDTGYHNTTKTFNVAGLSEEALRAKLAGADPSTAVPYSLGGAYAEGDLLLHAEFGLGIVARILSHKKMQVIFQKGLKILVMNYIPRQ